MCMSTMRMPVSSSVALCSRCLLDEEEDKHATEDKESHPRGFGVIVAVVAVRGPVRMRMRVA